MPNSIKFTSFFKKIILKVIEDPYQGLVSNYDILQQARGYGTIALEISNYGVIKNRSQLYPGEFLRTPVPLN